MRKLSLALSMFVMSLSAAALLHAQPMNDDYPLIISGFVDDNLREQVLFQYQDNEWQPLLVEGFFDGSRSPDGKTFAYRRMPPFLREIMDDGQDWLFSTAWDVSLFNLEDGSQRVIAAQPAITSDTNGYSGGIKRSRPIWSPDGSALAWTEQDYPAQNSARLVVYSLDTETSTILDEALPQMTLSADGLPSLISWGLPGIVVFTNDPSDAAATLRFYDPDNGNSHIVRFPDREAESIPLTNPLWVTITESEASRDVTVVQMRDYAWYQFDPVTNEIAGLGTRLEAISAANPKQSLRLVWDIYAADPSAWTLLATDGTELMNWANSQVLNTPAGYVPFGIAPNGQAAAFLQNDKLWLWQDGVTLEIALPPDLWNTELSWGLLHWQAGEAYDGVG